jgi:hypothetical protein
MVPVTISISISFDTIRIHGILVEVNTYKNANM